MPPERPTRWTLPDRGNGGSGDGGGKSGVGGGSSTGRDNGLQCRWRSPPPSLSSWGGDGGRDDDNGAQKGGRGDGKAMATTRQRRGNKDAKAIGYDAAGGRGNEAINKSITNNINN